MGELKKIQTLNNLQEIFRDEGLPSITYDKKATDKIRDFIQLFLKLSSLEQKL